MAYLSYDELKKKISEERKKQLKLLNVVSNDENAIWLIDYWCGKDIRGLIQMPFSRHWIMHVEASLRIKKQDTFISAIPVCMTNDNLKLIFIHNKIIYRRRREQCYVIE